MEGQKKKKTTPEHKDDKTTTIFESVTTIEYSPALFEAIKEMDQI